MDLTFLLYLGAGGLVIGVPGYFVTRMAIVAALQKEAKGLAIDTVFKQFGLNRQGVKFWNDLSPEGCGKLILVLKASQSSTGSLAGGGYSAQVQKTMQLIQGLTQMAGQVQPNVAPPQ